MATFNTTVRQMTKVFQRKKKFSGTCSSVEMLKRYMVRQSLGTSAALNHGSTTFLLMLAHYFYFYELQPPMISKYFHSLALFLFCLHTLSLA